jgi:hypothetical protein
MAIKRMLVYRAGTVGLICAAFEAAAEPGYETSPGTLRPIRECSNLPTVMLNGTRFCESCADAISRSSNVGVVTKVTRSGITLERRVLAKASNCSAWESSKRRPAWGP